MPEEFQQSLDNINKTVTSVILIIIFVIVPFLCLIGGALVMIVGSTVSKDSETNKSVLLLAIGGGVLGFGVIFLIAGVCIMQVIQKVRMRKAVEEESEKYRN